MWLANFEDGSTSTSKQVFWTQLPKDKKLTGLQLKHPYLPNLYLNLLGYDQYYFVTEAVAMQSGADISQRVIAEIIGGINSELGSLTEVRLDYQGSVKVRTYPSSVYRYSKDILLPGARKEKPVTEAA